MTARHLCKKIVHFNCFFQKSGPCWRPLKTPPHGRWPWGQWRSEPSCWKSASDSRSHALTRCCRLISNPSSCGLSFVSELLQNVRNNHTTVPETTSNQSCGRTHLGSQKHVNISFSNVSTKTFFLLPRVQTEEEMIICVSEHVPLLRRTVFTAQLPFCTVDTINFSALQLTFSLFFLIDYLSSHTNLTFSAANVCNKCNLCMSANVYIELILYWSSSSS